MSNSINNHPVPAACGSSRIVGCRFSLFPMSDRFVPIILGALEKTDTSKVWIQSDDVSTCVRGRHEHVFDVVQSIFLQAATSGEHVVLSATFSVGCPGDTEGDAFMSEDDVRLNKGNGAAVDTAVQFALYPMGVANYMDVIYDAVKAAEAEGTFTGGIHYASRLDGDVRQVFRSLENAFVASSAKASHLVMTTTISCNSPSAKPDHAQRKGE
ncbi:YkoF family thiamine/hydroxymethylpyrimidine-binding protein [Paenibacillus ihumii]|uniref:YkoF family thiamine/hydroxymethylpyrimidine-binding protein n=1 Tax=Paenibacillus ihumii TaxID=687436 RepID=UPI0006D781C0|nr:YkoF family thiamine/hydroxymethylpyrimidine-binding protein [Paenibacillus ihumii]